MTAMVTAGSGGSDEKLPNNASDVPATLDQVTAAAPAAAAAPAQNTTLDEIRRGKPQREKKKDPRRPGQTRKHVHRIFPVEEFVRHLYGLSYLIFFSIFGTLARVGLSHLTTYPGAPTIFPTLWANVAGSLIMGFLTEDRKLFFYEPGVQRYDSEMQRARWIGDAASPTTEDAEADPAAARAAARKAQLAMQKRMPLYIGLTTGFCGSLTSFSTFIRDVFLALSNDMLSPDLHGLTPGHRNSGYSVMALLAVIIETVGLSLGAYTVGLHLGAALEPHMPTIDSLILRRYIDRPFIFVGWALWLGALFMAVFPPHDSWRGTALFAIVFAPLGCLTRYYLSRILNPKSPTFPLGTFVANVFGTVILGMAWDIAHTTSTGGVLGCQLLQGVEDGFCGCLTTVSTWVSELSTLRRKSAYIYGTASVVVSTALMIIIMGSLRWTQGFAPLQCHP